MEAFIPKLSTSLIHLNQLSGRLRQLAKDQLATALSDVSSALKQERNLSNYEVRLRDFHFGASCRNESEIITTKKDQHPNWLHRGQAVKNSNKN